MGAGQRSIDDQCSAAVAAQNATCPQNAARRADTDRIGESPVVTAPSVVLLSKYIGISYRRLASSLCA